MFKNAVPNPQQVSHITLESVLEWNGTSRPSVSRPHEIIIGNTTSSSWFIQSDDGCFDKGIMSLGCVIKDTNDRVLAANCQRISNFADIAIVEIMGIL